MNNLFQSLQNQQMNNVLNNPQLNQVLKLIKQSGKSPKELFYDKAKEMGVDPDSILNKLR